MRRSKSTSDSQSDSTALYKCLHCGRSFQTPKSNLCLSPSSPYNKGNDNYSGYCLSCCNKLFNEISVKLGAEKALIVLCCITDIYYDENYYLNHKHDANLSFSTYKKSINLGQYKSKDFITYLLNKIESYKQLTESAPKKEHAISKWSNNDLKNKGYVFEIVGYDPFDDGNYDDNDRKYLFNTVAGYFTDEIIEDPHKIQSVISIAKTNLQLERIDKLINEEFSSPSPTPNVLRSYETIKNGLIGIINQTANENGISAKTSGKRKTGANALTSIMREALENGYDDIKVNYSDICLSDSFKEVAEANAKALISELEFTSDDYAHMLAEQSKLVTELQEENMAIREENRKIKAEIHQLRKKVGKS